MKKAVGLVFLFFLLSLGVQATQSLAQVARWDESMLQRVVVQGNIAYAASHSDVYILDISNPLAPRKAGQYTHPYEIQGFHAAGNYVYIASVDTANFGSEDALDGLWVIDATDPASPRQVGYYSKYSASCVYVSGNYAYVGGLYKPLDSTYGGFDVVDISNPAVPVKASAVDMEGITAITVKDNIVYAAYRNTTRWSKSEGIIAVDCSNPASPVSLNSFRSLYYSNFPPTNEYTGDFSPSAIHAVNDYVYFSTNSEGDSEVNRLYILNSEMQQVATFDTPEEDNQGRLFISGIYAYIAQYTAELNVLDISDTLNLVQVAGGGNDTVRDVFAAGSYVYVAGDAGLTVLEDLEVNNAPFGTFETPLDGATAMGSIPITGWVLDDKGVTGVQIFRDAIAGEGTGMIYIGDATLVKDARPDVASAYPTYPNNDLAGWGYMLLTLYNMPNNGNGSVRLHAIATDSDGVQTKLGSKTITLDNANAVKPFGAIDTPIQGGTAAGGKYSNWGWVLTPQPNTIPTDGSTINVYMDGVNLGHPTYNLFREDVAALFPGYNNSGGAFGYFVLDTTKYADGVHSIMWTAEDDAGNAEGIGSRYFTIQNTSNRTGSAASTVSKRYQRIASHSAERFPAGKPAHGISPTKHSPLYVTKGFGKNTLREWMYEKENEIPTIHIATLERVEITLPDSIKEGFLLTGNKLNKLPVGSTLDTEGKTFRWIPGPGFKGDYDLVFMGRGPRGNKEQKKVRIRVAGN
ncbi:MAG: hypothetical protein GY765_11790 [bacterium]|nr:hypothetical protein [bacterium]